jgi:hypothetical protein
MSYPFACHFASTGLYGHTGIAISHLQILHQISSIVMPGSIDYAFVFEDDAKLQMTS